jgi:hypothetical protein
MDVVLIILGILGVGAIAISAYVFTVAARNYVSDDYKNVKALSGENSPSHLIERSPTDRRSNRPVTFPLTVNGLLIANDRRVRLDRRLAS